MSPDFTLGRWKKASKPIPKRNPKPKSLPTAPKSAAAAESSAERGGLSVMNRGAMNQFGQRGNAALKFNALVIGGGGIVGGGCLAGGCAAVGTAAITHGNIAGPIAAAAFGGGMIGMVEMGGANGGGLPDGIAKDLALIYEQNPATSGDCECAAKLTREVFNQAGIEGEIIRLYDNDGAAILKDAQGREIGKNGFHETFKVDDRYYDALTGHEGATWEEYLELWHPEDTAPYLTPNPRFNIEN